MGEAPEPAAGGGPDDVFEQVSAVVLAVSSQLSVRDVLGKSPQEFPLACVLEGGTWAAGREIGLERRPAGAAPLTVISDGTLF